MIYHSWNSPRIFIKGGCLVKYGGGVVLKKGRGGITYFHTN